MFCIGIWVDVYRKWRVHKRTDSVGLLAFMEYFCYLWSLKSNRFLKGSEATSVDSCLYKRIALILQCPVTCGKGMKHRQVWCQLNDEHLRDDFCNPNDRPESVTLCELHECASWEVGPWGHVSTEGFLFSSSDYE